MTAPAILAQGSLFAGRFEIGRELGRGGYSVVYAARDRELGAEAALKVLVPSPAAAALVGERTRREVLAVRMLSHANIVAVYDIVEDGPYAAIVMELVEGEDLDVRVRRRGALAADEVVAVGRDIAAALGAAHRRGILHRDVKPQNILIDGDGRARLTDFGSARMDGDATITRTGTLVGTVAFMSPESVAGRRGDARSDVFALGMTLHLAIAGRLPDRPSPHLPPPSRPEGYDPREIDATIPTWLALVVARATAADPRDRYPTPVALAEALDAGDDGESIVPARGIFESCAVCDAPDPLGLGICVACGGSNDRADTLIFLDRPRSRDERRRAAASLMTLRHPGVSRSALDAASRGQQALLRVPSTAAQGVIERLAARRIAASALPSSRAWRRLPAAFHLLLSAVVVYGLIAGMVAEPLLLWTTGPFAMLLLISADRGARSPALGGADGHSAIPAEVRRRVVESLATLPAGPARTLLADIVRRGHSLHRSLARRGDDRGLATPLDTLLEASCAGALELAALDDDLARLAIERRSTTPAGEAEEESTGVERRRDAVVQRLLDAMTVLARLDARSTLDAEEIGLRLSEVVAELESEARAREQAAAEVEALLRPAAG